VQSDGSVRWKSAVAAAPSPTPTADRQLLVFSGETTRTFPLPAEGRVSIGRGKATLNIDDPSVSRHHAILHIAADGKLVIEDLGSANGTLIRNRGVVGSLDPASPTIDVQQIRGRSAALAVGDSLLFGTAIMMVRHVPTVDLPDLDADPSSVIVRDASMRALYAQAALAARSLINVLILGETGVGKEVLARAIHAHSRRANGIFLAVSCATFTESLQESELFGYEKGAFTGAVQARAGVFEAANGGTLFLDEVGELAPSTQAKLLRVLAEREVVRVGSTVARPLDVRVVAATNRDVEVDSETGKFRRDLYFRLNGISLLIPPLRERASEIEPLARMFLAEAAREVDRVEPPRLSTEALALLHRHSWPGNVRELRHVIERAVALCVGDTIWPELLPPSMGRPPGPRTEGRGAPIARPFESSSERDRIVATLEDCAGNQTRTAALLGMSRRTLVTRLDEYGIPRPRKIGKKPIGEKQQDSKG
jgi:two-component system response regulator AtoC